DSTNGLTYRCVSTGDGTHGFAYTVGSWAPGWQVSVADFNADGISDLFIYNPTTGLFYKVLNTGTSFTYSADVWAKWTTAIVDLNGDGKSDILLTDSTSGLWYQALTTSPTAFGYTSGSFR